MRREKRLALACMTALACAAFSATGRADSGDADLAMNHADQFSWTLFARVSAPAADGKLGWQHWATNQDTFPASPDPKVAPAFPAQPPKMLLEPINQQLLRLKLIKGFLAPNPNNLEEVRRNRADFNFIAGNGNPAKGLYYQEAVAAALERGDVIQFPADAIEIKATWTELSHIPQNLRSHYYMSVAADHKTYGLVGLHIMSKTVPNWTWATFEQADTDGRCDYIGCHDSFGAVDVNVDPNNAVNGSYPNCTHTTALKSLLQKAGLTQPVWDYYCLKGSQVDFADTRGWATRLGNSVTERGFVQTSSCMSCHMRASFNSAFASKYGGGFNDDGTGPLGYPDPSTFYNVTPPVDFTKNPPKLDYIPVDFVWSFMRASPAKATKTH